MALMKCKECGKEVSTTAPTCPHCGAKVKGAQTTSGCAWIVLFIIAFPLLLVMCTSGSRKQEQQKATAARQAAAAAESARLAAMTPEQRAAAEKQRIEVAFKAAEAEQRRQGLRWNYSTSADEMGRGTIRTAAVRSQNTVDLKFPYAGEQRGALILRAHPAMGQDVIFRIERGQLLCGVTDCLINVRFGTGTPVKYTAAGPDDHNTTTLFIRNDERFVSNLRKAKTVSIEVTLYQSGLNVFTFDTSGLDWK